MAKAAEFGPRIRQRLEATATGDPVTVQELAQSAGCSVQQVYKVLQQLGSMKAVVGQSPTGAYLYRYDPAGQETPKGFERKATSVAKSEGAGPSRGRGKRQPRQAVLQINDLLTIKGIREGENGTVEIEFENDAGERVRAVVVEGSK